MEVTVVQCLGVGPIIREEKYSKIQPQTPCLYDELYKWFCGVRIHRFMFHSLGP